MVEYRPSHGSCARCLAALGTAAVRVDGVWYCSSSCAEGRPAGVCHRAVPESRLYGVPRRYFRKRKPKELRAAEPRDRPATLEPRE